jgi:hypothetical protein
VTCFDHFQFPDQNVRPEGVIKRASAACDNTIYKRPESSVARLMSRQKGVWSAGIIDLDREPELATKFQKTRITAQRIEPGFDG